MTQVRSVVLFPLPFEAGDEFPLLECFLHDFLHFYFFKFHITEVLVWKSKNLFFCNGVINTP